MTDSRTFLLEEHKSLRKEIELYLTEARSLERYTIIAVYVVWGWLITNHIHNGWVWFVPILITTASLYRMSAIYFHFERLAAHIQETERAFYVKGWEHKRKQVGRLMLGLNTAVLSFTLFIIASVSFLKKDELANIIPRNSCDCVVQQHLLPVRSRPALLF